jgi:hypothetical protein
LPWTNTPAKQTNKDRKKKRKKETKKERKKERKTVINENEEFLKLKNKI